MDGGNENEFVSPATIPPNTDIENEDIGLPPTGIGVRPDPEENQTDNPNYGEVDSLNHFIENYEFINAESLFNRIKSK